METIKDLYTVADLARLADLTEPYIRMLIAKGKIEASKFSGAYIISKEAAERFLQEREGKQ